jgi:hypothetical protein
VVCHFVELQNKKRRPTLQSRDAVVQIKVEGGNAEGCAIAAFNQTKAMPVPACRGLER